MSSDSLLGRAAYTGNMRVARRALARGANPDALLRDETALWWAAQEGHTALVQLLLNAGANVHFTGSNGFTPLYQAVGNGRLAAAELLLRCGANVNQRYADAGAGTVLHTAAAYGRLECIRLLLAYGADPHARDRENLTPHETALACGEDDAAELLRHGAANDPPQRSADDVRR